MTTLSAQTSRSSLSLADFDPHSVTDEWLESLDIAQVNLACSVGLPGAEDLDAGEVISKIEEWTQAVRLATTFNMRRFMEYPAQFDHSIGKFKMSVLASVLELECGVRYNPEIAKDQGRFAYDSKDRYIHGITHGEGGTCASLPVLFIAVGRRLGYPLKLGAGARHFFARWDESDSDSELAKDCFNIEATGGVAFPSDSHFQEWPFPYNEPGFLHSMTRREELAQFLAVRATVLMNNGKFASAIQPAAWARQLMPDDYNLQVHLELTMLHALGVVDDKPEWMDRDPVVQPDGQTWSRYWWPPDTDSAERLPAAKLPPEVLARLIPPADPNGRIGDMADVLYELAEHYADPAFVEQANHSAIAEQRSAEAIRHNEMVRSRQAAMLNGFPQPADLPGAPKIPQPAMPHLPPEVQMALAMAGQQPWVGPNLPQPPSIQDAFKSPAADVLPNIPNTGPGFPDVMQFLPPNVRALVSGQQHPTMPGMPKIPIPLPQMPTPTSQGPAISQAFGPLPPGINGPNPAGAIPGPPKPTPDHPMFAAYNQRLFQGRPRLPSRRDY
jgi:hypothetical protein